MSSGMSATGNTSTAVAPAGNQPGPDRNAVRVGIIGYGYWGPNIVRNLSAIDGCHVVAVCDSSRRRWRGLARHIPASM